MKYGDKEQYDKYGDGDHDCDNYDHKKMTMKDKNIK